MQLPNQKASECTENKLGGSRAAQLSWSVRGREYVTPAFSKPDWSLFLEREPFRNLKYVSPGNITDISVAGIQGPRSQVLLDRSPIWV